MLYNWFTVVDSRSLCPIGWHVPTDNEWNILIGYLGGDNIAGDKMKLSGIQYWKSPNSIASNESGFSGLPGGYIENGTFINVGYSSYWWSSTECNSDFAWLRNINFDYGKVIKKSESKSSGYSVRCLKD